MDGLVFSVIIRTTGNAGEKYQKLLDSIAALEPKPEEVIVVLPEGYELPKERLGWETFCFSPKGMVLQRMMGIERCRSKYALVCDDDVCFPPDFVKKLYRPIAEGYGRLSIAPLYEFLPPRGLNAVLCTIMGSASPTLFHRERYNSVMRTSGYSYNRHLKAAVGYYETQTAPWTCFFAEKAAIAEIDYMDECWIDSHGYSAMDDQTMFYKAWLRGIRTITVADAYYQHLDARTSTRGNREPFLYALAYNRIVFWHRFIYKLQPMFLLKGWSGLCFGYYALWMILFDVLGLSRRKMTNREFRVKYRGFFDGWRYIKSEEYAALPTVCRG